MIVVDANMLIYAYHSSAPEHETSLHWLDAQLAGDQQLALPWESLNAFTRIVSNPRIFPSPSTTSQAWEQVEDWLRMPNTWVPVPTPQHASIAADLYRSGTYSASDVPDIHLAALAISHGLKLATHDAGFARFDGLRWFDPLAE
ncbi:TA system VapC family ribonuclease toxin [Homoserinimonas sp. A520]